MRKKIVFRPALLLAFLSPWLATAQTAAVQPATFAGCTAEQGAWAGPSLTGTPGALLINSFSTVYPGGVFVGTSPFPSNFDLMFTTAAAVRNYLPQGGPPSQLATSATNPFTSASGVFGGQVLALRLNVDLYGFGSFVLTATGTPLDGKTVAQVLASANTALGTGLLPAGFASFSALNDLLHLLNGSYSGCVQSAWAVTHLVRASSLSVAKSHVGTFTPGGTGEWDVTVRNIGSAVTTVTTTVSDTLPAGYTIKNFSTTDPSWTCSGVATATCTSTAAVNGGGSFPTVKMLVNIPANSPSSVTNTANTYGGGDPVRTSLATAASSSDTVTVACPPVSITSLAATPNVLWPPNGKMVGVNLSDTTSGGCPAPPVSCHISLVSSSEPVDPPGDWTITGPLTVELRAERLGTRKGNTNGRVYTITVQCSDTVTNASKTTTVLVPHDQGH